MNITVYPYFGGKKTIMPEAWQRFGDPINFIDPLLGSNAPALSRPGWDWDKGVWSDGRNRIETVNDKDSMIANFWRATQYDAQTVAHWADWPVNETDLHARHKWLIEQKVNLEKDLIADPEFYDSKIAGWWVWGISQWIGSSWCKKESRKRSKIGYSTSIQIPHLNYSQGIQRPHLSTSSMGTHRPTINLYSYFEKLKKRLRQVRVCCGDWTRVLGPSPTTTIGLTAVFLDPPYGEMANRDDGIYNEDSPDIANQVRAWAIENGDNPLLRIALCGYIEEHDTHMPPTWERLQWKARGGYSTQRKSGENHNKKRECIWFSPHCLKIPKQLSLFNS